MKAIGGILLTATAVLAVIASVVCLMDDKNILTPPPETVVENFVRSLANRRFEPARRALAEKVRTSTNSDSIRRYSHELHDRFGAIVDVEGSPGRTDLQVAEASANLKLADGRRARLTFPLRREHGLWRISELRGRTSP